MITYQQMHDGNPRKRIEKKEKYLKNQWTKSSQIWLKNINQHIQEAQQILRIRNSERPTPRCIINIDEIKEK